MQWELFIRYVVLGISILCIYYAFKIVDEILSSIWRIITISIKPKPNRKRSSPNPNLTEEYKFIELGRAAGEFGFNINDTISETDLKNRFRDKVKEVHPDHGGNVEDFIRVKRSYDLLVNNAIVF